MNGLKRQIDQLREKLEALGDQGAMTLRGLESPRLSRRWTTGAGGPAADPAEPFQLDADDETWLAPAAGILRLNSPPPTGLWKGDGTPVANAVVFELLPPVVLKLRRLYAVEIEGQSAGAVDPQRPVPRFFVYHERPADPNEVAPGVFHAGDELQLSGTASIHDERGLPIDPFAVASAFAFLLEQRPETLPVPAAPEDPPWLRELAASSTGDPQTRVHLVDPHGAPAAELKGAPVDGNAGLTNLASLGDAADRIGLFRLDDPADALTGRDDAPAALAVGPAAAGTLGDSYTPRPLAASDPSAAPPDLHRDFLRVVAVDQSTYLLGDRPDDDPAAPFESRPVVRLGQSLDVHLRGSQTLGAARAILEGATGPRLVVSPAIDGAFTVPPSAADALWPKFPAAEGTATAAESIPPDLADRLEVESRFMSRADGGNAADVLLRMSGFAAASDEAAPGYAVRVYPRELLPDGRERRAAGAGGAVAGDAVTLRFPSPFGDGRPPSDAVLHFDLVVNTRQSPPQTRVFGNRTAAVGPEEDGSPAAPDAGTNLFDEAERRGIATSAFPGLNGEPPGDGDDVDADFLARLAQSFSAGGTPREAPRLPTMRRRESLIAARRDGQWFAQAGAARLIPESLCSAPRRGDPGCPGGVELDPLAVNTPASGAATSRLAYDIARAALRRTTELPDRLVELTEAAWEEPDPPGGDDGGTIAAALLQTVSPFAETPELGPFGDLLDDIPATWDDFVTQLRDSAAGGGVTNFISQLPAVLRTELQNRLRSFSNRVEGDADRLIAEFRHEFSAAVHGRRDAYWSLRSALGRARHLIYIEGTHFNATGGGGDAGEPDPHDLIDLIADRFDASPQLKVVLALSKEPEFGPGERQFAQTELRRREAAVLTLLRRAPDRVLAFHPAAFPGRSLRLPTQVVVIDDVYALAGASTFRRRGLTFDGSSDLVLFDRAVDRGVGGTVTRLRRDLMASRTGLDAALLTTGEAAFEQIRQMLDPLRTGLLRPAADGQPPRIGAVVPAGPVLPFTRQPPDAGDGLGAAVVDPNGRALREVILPLIAAAAVAGQS